MGEDMTAAKPTAAEKKAAAAAAKAAEDAKLKEEAQLQAEAAAEAEAEAKQQLEAAAAAAKAAEDAKLQAEAAKTAEDDKPQDPTPTGDGNLPENDQADNQDDDSDANAEDLKPNVDPEPQAEETAALGRLQLRVTNHGKRSICQVTHTVIEAGETVVIEYDNLRKKILAQGNFAQLNAFSRGKKRFTIEG